MLQNLAKNDQAAVDDLLMVRIGVVVKVAVVDKAVTVAVVVKMTVVVMVIAEIVAARVVGAIAANSYFFLPDPFS
jgi:hypothetical protein